MPWDAGSFKSKHFHDASPGQAKAAAAMANAMLKRGVPEGEAIATAIKHAKGKNHIAHRMYPEQK